MDTKPTTFLTADSVERCTRCSGYLSVFPVTISSDRPFCGRCPNPGASRACVYNSLARHFFFPCNNFAFSCNAALAYGTVQAHEKICKYAPVLCPALHCLQEFRNDKVVEHFETAHKELVASDREFKVPCGFKEENSLVTKLFVWNSRAFILKINYSSFSCFCEVSSWESSDTGNLKYNLLIQDEAKQQSLQIKDIAIAKYEMRDHDNSTMTKLDVDTLKRRLNAKTIVCTVSIAEGSRNFNSVNDSLLSEVECPICLDYLRPPIFMCTSGHSICHSCKSKIISKCPICRGPLGDNRNVALEKIIERITFPCRNRSIGCYFTGTLSKVTLHEAICPLWAKTPTKCYASYIEKCTWSGPLSEMMSHLCRRHPEYSFNILYSVVFDLDKLNVWRRITKCNGQFFKVHVSRNSALDLQFGVQILMHPSLKNSKYQFYIDFIDLNKKNRILKINGDCVVSQFDDDDFTLGDSVNISNQLLKRYAKNNVVEVEIHLVEYGDHIDPANY